MRVFWQNIFRKDFFKKDIFKKDIFIKIISFLAAMLLWFFVLNTDNPYIPQKITVPLIIENKNTLLDRNIQLKDENYRREIDIIIRGRKDVVDKVSPDDFTVVLDFSKVKSSEDKTLAINEPVYNLKDITIESVSPTMIDIELEKIEKITLPIDVVLNGAMKPGYKIVTVVKTPETITLEDFRSLIADAVSIKAIVDITNLDKDLSVKKECRVYDKNSKEITALSKNLTVDIKLEVAKEVPVILVTKGQPAKDYIEVSRQVSPETVLIEGPYDVVANMAGLKTETVDIANISSNVKVTRKLKLPQGVKLVNTPEEISVSVIVEKLAEQDFIVDRTQIDINNTAADNSLKYEITTRSVTVSVKGKQADIDNLSINSMKPALDVSGLKEGSHKIPLKIFLPSTVELVKDISNVEVNIKK